MHNVAPGRPGGEAAGLLSSGVGDGSITWRGCVTGEGAESPAPDGAEAFVVDTRGTKRVAVPTPSLLVGRLEVELPLCRLSVLAL
jgi:hypothetical protein